MATSRVKIDKPEVYRKVQVKTTYEYIPLLGGILGHWRRVNREEIGETVEVHLQHSLNEYDRLFINGQEIPLPFPQHKI